MKKFFTAIILMLILVACGGNTIPEKEVLVIVGPDSVEVDDVIKLTTNVSTTVNWFSNDERVASVSGGFVTGIREGTVTIHAEKATNIGIFDSIVITVLPKTIVEELDDLVYYHSKILSIDKMKKKIELLDCTYSSYDSQTKFAKVVNDQISFVSIDDFYIGMENIYVACSKRTETIKVLLMEGEPGFNNIRVGIRKTIGNITDDDTLYHDNIELYFSDKALLQTYNGTFLLELATGTRIDITKINETMKITNGSKTILESSERIIFTSLGGEIEISSIERNGRLPSYAGSLEVAIYNNRLIIVNDIDIEDYLIKVVPSEMPAYYNKEALKAQAIAARTYAYMDIFRKANDQFGYTVDDSEMSQVYNNTNINENTSLAVQQTKSMVMFYEGMPTQAYFYSTSSGLTANAHDVWITRGEEGEIIPYLLGKNLTSDEANMPISFDYTDEESVLNFFKTIKMNTPDANVVYHRWKLSLTKEDVTDMLRANLASMYQSYPNLILTKEQDQWLSKPIFRSIGSVTNMYVDVRGESGVVISLVIETTRATYKIINQYNIRFTLRPRDALNDIVVEGASSSSETYTNTWLNPGNLFSGFFAIEEVDGEFILYGGGNGHGVGMSQNGANGLAKAGKDYNYILKSYYSDIDILDISYDYIPINNYTEILIFATKIS